MKHQKVLLDSWAQAMADDTILKDVNPWEALAKVVSEQSQVYKWELVREVSELAG